MRSYRDVIRKYAAGDEQGKAANEPEKGKMMGNATKRELEINKIRERLRDEESKVLFEARLDHWKDADSDRYLETVRSLYQDWHTSTELQEKLSKNPKGIIIFGAGIGGRMIYNMLPFFVGEKYRPIYFCDNYKAGETVAGTKVLSVDEAARDYGDYLIIVGTFRYGDEAYRQLIEKGFREENILLSENKLLTWSRGNQYFDVFSPRKDEVFIDAGAFNGDTSKEFLKWAGENCKKIYALEPLNHMYQEICGMHIPKAEILNYAAWNRQEDLFFSENSSSSSVNDSGEVKVRGMDIDSVANENVTFIKMDIEGSERKALEGARQTILNCRPRLAICIYHKAEDVIEIPSYILELVPEYTFYIRHYSSHMWETVLYAEVSG